MQDNINNIETIKTRLKLGREIECLCAPITQVDEDFPLGFYSSCTIDDFEDDEDLQDFLNGEHEIFKPLQQGSNNIALHQKNQYDVDCIIEITDYKEHDENDIISELCNMQHHKKPVVEMLAYLDTQGVEYSAPYKDKQKES